MGTRSRDLYDGKLLPRDEGGGRRADRVEQSRRGLDALLSDAEIAQKALADLFTGLSEGGNVVDPGVKSRARIEEKARSRQKDDPSPPYLLVSFRNSRLHCTKFFKFGIDLSGALRN